MVQTEAINQTPRRIFQCAGSLGLGLAAPGIGNIIKQGKRRRNRHRLAKHFTRGKAKSLEGWSQKDVWLVPPTNHWSHGLQKAFELLPCVTLRVTSEFKHPSATSGDLLLHFQTVLMMEGNMNQQEN